MSNMFITTKRSLERILASIMKLVKGKLPFSTFLQQDQKNYQMSHKVKVKTKTNIKKGNHTHEESSRRVLVENANI